MSLTDLNIAQFINIINGIIVANSGYVYSLPYNTSSSSTNTYYSENTKVLSISIQSTATNYFAGTLYLSFEYTKTTDSAGTIPPFVGY